MEQDPPREPQVDSDNELPTYEQLAAQHGPNSRFGRWQGWVEKRAAERYADDTPEKRHARKMKGWGPHIVIEPASGSSAGSLSPQPTLSRTRTVLSDTREKDSEPQVPATLINTAQTLPPSHMELHTFGSRFLPHAEQPILALLPICNESMLLMGHADGLSVLILKNDSSSDFINDEPRRRDIWRGQGVYQLELLESEPESSSRILQGVVLALVGTDTPESGSDKESKGPHRAIRMYSLASLVNLARWASARKDNECLDAAFLTQSQDTYSKRSKPRVRIPKTEQLVNTVKLMSLSPDKDHSVPPPVPPKDTNRGSSQSPLSSTRMSSFSSEWDVVDRGGLAIQWMTEYVPLASPGSRLVNQSVLFFELLRSPKQGRVTARLIVSTKQNMLLYETVRGERAFRYVKEFYLPLPPRSATFIYQSTQDLSASPRSATTLTQTWSYDSSTPLLNSIPSNRRASSPVSIYPGLSPLNGHISLFVIFEKKAGLIRISDSAVGEVDLWEGPSHSRRSSAHFPTSSSSSSSLTPFRLSTGPFESLSLSKDSKGGWLPPAEVSFPSSSGLPNSSLSLYLLTRGKTTHILPSPLPVPLASYPPLKILRWESPPNCVIPRACQQSATKEYFLQVTALSDDGVEVLEFPLTFLHAARDSGKARDETVVVQAEVGPGGAGFLCKGGHWADEVAQSGSSSHPSPSTVDIPETANDRFHREEGFYAWTQKGYNDWRVFWLGGR